MSTHGIWIARICAVSLVAESYRIVVTNPDSSFLWFVSGTLNIIAGFAALAFFSKQHTADSTSRRSLEEEEFRPPLQDEFPLPRIPFWRLPHKPFPETTDEPQKEKQ